MLNNQNNQSLESQSRTTQVAVTQTQLLVQRYLQSPFSVSWVKLAELFEAEALSNQK